MEALAALALTVLGIVALRGSAPALPRR